MANSNVWELEIKSSIPASKVFHEFVLGFFEFLAKNVIPKEFGMKFTTLEGDGGVGSVKLMSFLDDQFPSVKYKVKGLDLENFTYNLVMIKDDGHELSLSEMKVIPSVDGGCVFRQKNTDFEEISEDEIETHKGQLTQYFQLAIVLQKAKQIQDFGPTSGIRASRGTLMMMKHHTMKMHQRMVLQPNKAKQQLIPTTTTISNIKLPIMKKEENGNSKKRILTGKDGVVRILPPVSAAEIHVVEKERKARTISLMAIPNEHLRRFHGMDDAKEIWEAIRTRFGAHGAEVSTEDANHKFLRSLPPAWSNLAMTMRTKPDVDTLSIDDFKSSSNKVKSGHTGAYSTCTPTSSNNFQEREVPAGFADEVIYSLFAKHSEDLDLLHEDLEQIDDVHIEEIDINGQIAMIAIRMKKFYKNTGRRVRIDGNKPVVFDKKKLECFKCHNTGHFARECPSKGTNDGKKRDSFYQDQGAGKKEKNQNCLLTMDDGVVN
ncbi:ribonuclease H-like domain-containing protein [Tanacetum coccineum]